MSTGALVETGLNIPANQSITWLLSVPARVDATQNDVQATLSVLANGNDLDVADEAILVIYRNGFNTAYGDGAQAASVLTPEGGWHHGAMVAVDVDPGQDSGVQALARSSWEGGWMMLDQLANGDQRWMRLRAAMPDASERATAWLAWRTDDTPHLGLTIDEDGAAMFHLVLGDATAELSPGVLAE